MSARRLSSAGWPIAPTTRNRSGLRAASERSGPSRMPTRSSPYVLPFPIHPSVSGRPSPSGARGGPYSSGSTQDGIRLTELLKPAAWSRSASEPTVTALAIPMRRSALRCVVGSPRHEGVSSRSRTTGFPMSRRARASRTCHLEYCFWRITTSARRARNHAAATAPRVGVRIDLDRTPSAASGPWSQ